MRPHGLCARHALRLTVRGGQAVTELLQCRFTMKNFAWNEHWTMFLSYGLLKEARQTCLPCRTQRARSKRLPLAPHQLYDLMVPVIFALNLFGEKLQWSRPRKVRRWCRRTARAAGTHGGSCHRCQIAYTIGIPLAVAVFLLFWHAVRTPVRRRLRRYDLPCAELDIHGARRASASPASFAPPFWGRLYSMGQRRRALSK